MFRFSDDEFLANKQKEEATFLLESLSKYFIIKHSPEIEKFFDDNVKSYEFLEELPKLSRINNDIIVVPCMPHNYNDEWARMNLGECYQELSYSWKDVVVPFIEFSLPENYKCKHGDAYKHAYFFFLTKFVKFEDTQDCVLHYLNKLNKLKAFL